MLCKTIGAHRYHIRYASDADYIVLESCISEGWTEHSRWMIPGTWIEED